MEWHHHTKIKLRLLRQYLWVCSRVHKRDPKKFYYFETNAGDGIAEFEDGVEDGSALIAAKNDMKFNCILMEKDPEVYAELYERIKKFPNVIPIKDDCNKNIDKILKRIPKWFHSLGFIDPTGPNDIKWPTIKAIIEHQHIYKNGDIRRPELLINFPLKRIKQNAGNCDKINEDNVARLLCQQNTDFFGDDEWMKFWKSKELLRDYYMSKFKPYYKYSYWVLVTQIKKNVPQYNLMFFTNNPLADKIMNDITKKLEQWKKEDWVRDYYKVSPITKWME